MLSSGTEGKHGLPFATKKKQSKALVEMSSSKWLPQKDGTHGIHAHCQVYTVTFNLVSNGKIPKITKHETLLHIYI